MGKLSSERPKKNNAKEFVIAMLTRIAIVFKINRLIAMKPTWFQLI
jgi:hypothetical protein